MTSVEAKGGGKFPPPFAAKGGYKLYTPFPAIRIGPIATSTLVLMPKPNKTHATAASVDAFIDKQASEAVRDDCRTLMKLMHELTGEAPHMYGPTIVGYGTYHYKYASGHEGSAPLAAFSPRKPELVIYAMGGIFEQEPELMKKLGKHKATKGCVYVKRLDDIDLKVLKALVKKSIAMVKKTYSQS